MALSERGFTRREAVTLISLGTLGLVACGTPQTERSGQNLQQTTGKEPVKSQDTELKVTTVNLWTSLLSQEKTDDAGANGITTFKPRILNSDLQKITQQILNGGNQSEPLKASWHTTWFKKDPQNGVAGEKHYGEIQFRNMRIAVIGGGAVVLDFESQKRAVRAGLGMGWRSFSEEDSLKRWLTATDQPLPPFSQWEKDGYGIIFIQNGGRWQAQPNPNPKGFGAELTERFELPSRSMGQTGCGATDSSCKRITTELR